MMVAPALNNITFAIANWLGGSRLPKIFRTRGYLLGTSQVTPHVCLAHQHCSSHAGLIGANTGPQPFLVLAQFAKQTCGLRGTVTVRLTT